MAGAPQHALDRPFLHDLARVENHHPVTRLRHDGEIVAHEKNTEAAGLREANEKPKDPCLNGDVQGRGGLVDHQEFGLARQTQSEARALPHASRKPMWHFTVDPLGIREAHIGKETQGPAPCLVGRHPVVQAHHLHQLGADRTSGREGIRGVLENEGQTTASDPAELFVRRPDQFPAVEAHRTTGAGFDPPRQQTRQREGRERLAGPRLSHESHPLSRSNVERDPIHRPGPPLSGRYRDAQIANHEHRGAHTESRARGSNSSRTASATRFRATTTATSDRPAKPPIHQ